MINHVKPVDCGPEPYPVYTPDRRTRAVWIINEGKEQARLGGYRVTSTTGIPLEAGIGIVLEQPHELEQEWYAMCPEYTLLSVTVIQ